MSIEGFPGEDLSFLQKGPEKAFDGEFKKPVTELGIYVLDAIALHGDDNKPPFDKYSPQQRTLDPGVEVLGHGGRREFGADYFTHTFDLGRREIICAYSKTNSIAKIYINEFMEGGGVAAQYSFTSNKEEPDVIRKSRQTDFSGNHGHFPHVFEPLDFSRKLKASEKHQLHSALINPLDTSKDLDALLVYTRTERLLAAREKARIDSLDAEWNALTEANRGKGFILHPRYLP